MTQPGETEGFSLQDHLRILSDYVDLSTFDSVIVNDRLPDERFLCGYRNEAVGPVENDLPVENAYGLRVIRADLAGIAELEGKWTIKHDPRRLARTIARNARAFPRQ
jgi:2-phospho-L-lactate transferase/gluconeogenesis factor (CofD/UPF0052 family)